MLPLRQFLNGPKRVQVILDVTDVGDGLLADMPSNRDLDITLPDVRVEVGAVQGQIAAVMERIKFPRGAVPAKSRADNGPEFISKVLDPWAYVNGVVMDFSRPGKPTDNAYIESFNGRFRDECLNTHWFLSLNDAKAKIEAGRRHYNEIMRTDLTHTWGI